VCCCYSHFTGQRYDWRYVLCRVSEIVETWGEMQQRIVRVGSAYALRGDVETDWTRACKLCLHAQTNEILFQARAQGDTYIDSHSVSADTSDFATI
jgi:hypothetical protein